MKHELQQMRTQGSGAIVNNSSLGGLVGLPGRAACHASKHGVIGLTKSAALEYAARGIRINAVPGAEPPVDEAAHRLGRLAEVALRDGGTMHPHLALGSGRDRVPVLVQHAKVHPGSPADRPLLEGPVLGQRFAGRLVRGLGHPVGGQQRHIVDLKQGDYEELDQMAAAERFAKAAYRVDRVQDIGRGVARAIRTATSGRPDPALRQLPAPEAVDRAIALLATAQRPLVVLGKGAAYSQADVVMLVGARLNWLLGHGQAPQWNPNATFIPVDIEPTELDSNQPIAAPLLGDVGSVMTALLERTRPGQITIAEPWRQELAARSAQNIVKMSQRLQADPHPMQFYEALRAIRDIPGVDAGCHGPHGPVVGAPPQAQPPPDLRLGQGVQP